MKHLIGRWRRTRREGFSLLELLAAMIILATLVRIAMPTFLDTQDEGYLAAMMTDLRNLAPQMQMHYAEHSQYPSEVAATGDGSATTLVFTTSPDVTLTISGADQSGYTVTAEHAKLDAKQCELDVRKGQGPRVECEDATSGGSST